MNDVMLLEIWDLMREYGDKKQLGILANKYVELLSENGVKDSTLSNMSGHDEDLDEAISELMGNDEDDDLYDYDDE
jgi:hypothetical protein